MCKGIRISGTLIMAVIYADSIVIAADAGGWGSISGEKAISLKDKKVVEINENVVCC